MITKSNNLDGKVLCIFHANCNDGVLAAAVVKKHNPKAEFYAMNYNDSLDNLFNLVTPETVVMFVDFSLPLPAMKTILETAKYTVVCDHHKGAKDNLEPLIGKYHNSFIIFDMDRSGAGITWDFLFPDEPRAPIIDLIEDRDLWKFKLPMTKLVTAIIRDEGMGVDTWTEYLDYSLQDISVMSTRGQAVLSHDEANINIEVNKQLSHPNQVAIHGVPTFHVFNSTTLISEQLNALLEHPKYELHAAVSFRIVGNKVQCSARSIDDHSAREVAMYFGGNGHPNASGFTLDIPAAIGWGFFGE